MEQNTTNNPGEILSKSSSWSANQGTRKTRPGQTLEIPTHVQRLQSVVSMMIVRLFMGTAVSNKSLSTANCSH